MFWDRFISECSRINERPNSTGKKLKISSGTISAWKNNGTLPNQQTLEKLADYFGCTIDYLVGRSHYRTLEEVSKNYATFSEQEKTLIKLFREISEEGRFEIIAQLMRLKDKATKEKVQ